MPRLLLLSGSQSQAASPQLSYVYPPGVQRGHEHVITFTGARLKDAEEILFYDGGVTVKKLEVVDPQNVRSRSKWPRIAGWASTWRSFRTKSGVSDYRSFFVGALPGVDEKEPNNDFDKPQPIDAKHLRCRHAAK